MAKLAVFVSVLLLLLLVAQLELSESNPMKVCCTQYQEKPIPRRLIKYYVIQDTRFCNIEAVILVMKNNKPVCGNPKSDWVQTIIGMANKHPALGNVYYCTLEVTNTTQSYPKLPKMIPIF